MCGEALPGASVRRARKVWRRLSHGTHGTVVEGEEKNYLGRVELKRIRTVDGATTDLLERSTLRVSDGAARIALVHQRVRPRISQAEVRLEEHRRSSAERDDATNRYRRGARYRALLFTPAASTDSCGGCEP